MLINDDRNSGPDLDAYVDGQLTDAQRAEVEAHLSRHPDAAAQVMRDIALGRDLRRAMVLSEPSPRILAAAQELARAHRRDMLLRRILRIVPALAMVAVGWLGHASFGPQPAHGSVALSSTPPPITAALSAHQVSLLRLNMMSQPEVRDLDPAEIKAATGILLPIFDDTWTLRDTQVFPSVEGPGLEILFDTHQLGQVSYFTVQADTFAVSMPTLYPAADHDIAWFQIGKFAHVLVADDAVGQPLLDASRHLLNTLY